MTGCSGGSAGSGPPRLDAAGTLAAAAGRLDGVSTFRLTMDTAVPPSTTAGATAGPVASYRIALSGVWDDLSHRGRMTGTLNGVGSTVLEADGVEYISLTPGSGAPAGKSWLKVDGGGTFGAFSDPHLVAQLLRAYHGVDSTRSGHVTGTILTAEADQHIADPNLLASLGGYPDSIAFDIAVDAHGAPTRVDFRLPAQSGRTSGTVALLDFGAPPPDVPVPTAAQVVEAPAPG